MVKDLITQLSLSPLCKQHLLDFLKNKYISNAIILSSSKFAGHEKKKLKLPETNKCTLFSFGQYS